MDVIFVELKKMHYYLSNTNAIKCNSPLLYCHHQALI